MKVLRYLLIAMVVVLASVTAQAQFTQNANTDYQFRSTSAMASSGSTLPNAAVTGTTTAGDCPTAYVVGRPVRRDVGGGSDETDPNDDVDPEDPEEPYPLGDGLWAMLVLTAGYAAFVAYRRRKGVEA